LVFSAAQPINFFIPENGESAQFDTRRERLEQEADLRQPPANCDDRCDVFGGELTA
jgi:hypothetical protein